MSKITIVGAERELEAPAGTSLLSALQQAGHPVSTSCGGVATCALCRVTVVSGREHLSPIVESEITHLGSVARTTPRHSRPGQRPRAGLRVARRRSAFAALRAATSSTGGTSTRTSPPPVSFA